MQNDMQKILWYVKRAEEHYKNQIYDKLIYLEWMSLLRVKKNYKGLEIDDPELKFRMSFLPNEFWGEKRPIQDAVIGLLKLELTSQEKLIK